MTQKTPILWRQSRKTVLSILLALTLVLTSMLGITIPASADDTIPAVRIAEYTDGQTYDTSVAVENGANYVFSFCWKAITNTPNVALSGDAVGARTNLAVGNEAQTGVEFDLASGVYSYAFTAQGTTLNISIATTYDWNYCDAYFASPSLVKVDGAGNQISAVDCHPDFTTGWGAGWGGNAFSVTTVAADYFETAVAPEGKMFAIYAEGYTDYRLSSATVSVENGASYVFSVLWKSDDSCAANFQLSGSAVGGNTVTLVTGNTAGDNVDFDLASGAYQYAFTAQGDSLSMTFNAVGGNQYTNSTYAAMPTLVKVDGSGNTIAEVDCDVNFDDIWTIGGGWSGQVFSVVTVATDYFETEVITDGYVKVLRAEGYTDYRWSGATFPVESGANYVLSVLWRAAKETTSTVTLSGSAIGDTAKTMMIGNLQQTGVAFDFESGTYSYAFTAQGDSLTMTVQVGYGNGDYQDSDLYFAAPTLVKVDGSGNTLAEVDCNPNFDTAWTIDAGWAGTVFSTETLAESIFCGRGDVNRDAVINILDLVAAKKAIAAESDDIMVDMNYDTEINAQDLVAFRSALLTDSFADNISYGASVAQ